MVKILNNDHEITFYRCLLCGLNIKAEVINSQKKWRQKICEKMRVISNSILAGNLAVKEYEKLIKLAKKQNGELGESKKIKIAKLADKILAGNDAKEELKNILNNINKAP